MRQRLELSGQDEVPQHCTVRIAGEVGTVLLPRGSVRLASAAEDGGKGLKGVVMKVLWFDTGQTPGTHESRSLTLSCSQVGRGTGKIKLTKGS